MAAAVLDPRYVERRARRRVAVRYETEFVPLHANQTLYGLTLDISATGLRVLSPQPLEVGTLVHLLVRPTNMSQSMMLHGRVVYHERRPGLGGHALGVALHPAD